MMQVFVNPIYLFFVFAPTRLDEHLMLLRCDREWEERDKLVEKENLRICNHRKPSFPAFTKVWTCIEVDHVGMFEHRCKVGSRTDSTPGA